MHVISKVGATSVKNPRTEEVHEADPDGVFRGIPLDFAHELVTRHASQWAEPSAYEAQAREAQLQDLRNPHALPKVVAELRDQAAKAEARLAALERHAGIGSAEPHEFDGLLATITGDQVQEASAPVGKAAPVRKTTASKRAAAKTVSAKPTGKRAAGKPKGETPAQAHAAAQAAEGDAEDFTADDSESSDE